MTTQASSVVTAPLEGTIPAKAARHFVRSYTGFDQLSPAYDVLFRTASTNSFFKTLPWFRNLAVTALNNDEQIRIFAVESESGSPIAALPLRHTRVHAGLFTVRALSSLSNYYTTRYEPVVDPGFPLTDSLSQLANAICA